MYKTLYKKFINHAAITYPEAFQRNQQDVIRLVKYYCRTDDLLSFDTALKNMWVATK